jgi:hypothetical protein
VGYQALSTMANDYYNVAVGYQALKVANLATNNTAVGALALVTNSSGASNTAIGSQALKTNSTGGNNTAVGYQAGYSMDTNGVSTYIGNQAGYLTTGYGNTFIGANSSVGGGSGGDMTTGNNNTIIGGFRGNSGGLDIRTKSNNVVLSDGAGNPVNARYVAGNVSTSTVDIAPSNTATGGLHFVSGYNTGDGSQGWWLIATRVNSVTTIASSNGTGLTVNFSQTSSVRLNATTTSGTINITCTTIS